jgi:HlyD family secretion protein
VVQQSVTMFPVLVSISNENGQLLPGMNGEVTMMVARQSDVLAISVDALRGMRDASTVASVLGLDPDSVRARARAQMASFASARPDSAGSRQMGAGGLAGGRPGRNAGAGAGGGSAARGGSRSGGGQAGGGRGGWSGQGGGSGGGAGGGLGGGASQAQVAFVKTASGYEARLVRVGVSDFEYTQVISGLEEGDEVALLSVAEVQAQRNALTNRIRSRMGSGLTGSGSGGSRPATGGGR